MTYSIDDGHGNQITTGLSAHIARSTAQRMADERGDAVSLYSGEDDAETIEPTEGAGEDAEINLEAGDRVEAGEGDEADAGIVQTIHGDQAWVGWDSGVRTLTALADLRPEMS